MTERLEIEQAQRRKMNQESIEGRLAEPCVKRQSANLGGRTAEGASGRCRLSRRDLRVRRVTLFLVWGGCLLTVEFLAWSAEETWSLGWTGEGCPREPCSD